MYVISYDGKDFIVKTDSILDPMLFWGMGTLLAQCVYKGCQVCKSNIVISK